MRLNTRLYSVTSLRMHIVKSYPPCLHDGMYRGNFTFTYFNTITLISSRNHYWHSQTWWHPRSLQLSCQLMMVTLWAVLTWHQRSNQQNRKCSIIRLICRQKPEFQYSWNGIICSIILWYNMYIHQRNLPQKCMSNIHDMKYSSWFYM